MVNDGTDIAVAVAVAVGTAITIVIAVEVHDERDEGIEVMIEVGIVIDDIVVITMMIGSVVGVKTGIGIGIGVGITVVIGTGLDLRTIIARGITLVPDHRIDLTAGIVIINAQTGVILPQNEEFMQIEVETGKVMIVEIEIYTNCITKNY